MNIEPRVQRAIDIFLDVLNEGTLAAGTCKACAVGNLVAAGMGIKIKVPRVTGYTFSEGISENEHWMANLLRAKGGLQAKFSIYQDVELGEQCIKATEFALDELMEIEEAFERNTFIRYDQYYKFSKEDIRKDQIKGLEAVVKVMLSFSDSKEDAEEVFTKRAELVPIK